MSMNLILTSWFSTYFKWTLVNENGKKIYTFWYYNKSTVSSIDTLNPKHHDFINEFKHSFTVEEFINLPDVDWKNMKYYHNAEPIIPE